MPTKRQAQRLPQGNLTRGPALTQIPVPELLAREHCFVMSQAVLVSTHKVLSVFTGFKNYLDE